MNALDLLETYEPYCRDSYGYDLWDEKTIILAMKEYASLQIKKYADKVLDHNIDNNGFVISTDVPIILD